MSAIRKRKVDSEHRVFNTEWKAKYFFIDVDSKPVCLICQENIAVLKAYNLNRHYTTKHPNYGSNLTFEEREIKAEELATNLKAQQKVFMQPSTEATTKASYALAFQLAKENKPFSEGEFLKACMVDVAGILCPEYQKSFESVRLSQRTITRCIRAIDEDLASELSRKADCFTLFSLALASIEDTGQLLVFIRGINETFEITEEFLSMASTEGTTKELDVYEKVADCLERLKLPWSKLASVTMNKLPDLAGENVGFVQRMQDKVKETDLTRDLVFLHCIMQQEVLCKTVLDIDHVVCTVVKIVHYIRARGRRHQQFMSLLEDANAEHQFMLCETPVGWLGLGKMLQRVWGLRKEIGNFLAEQGKEAEFPEFKDSNWVCDLAFAVDIVAHLSELNVKLQGKSVFAHEFYSSVKAFKVKLLLFSKQTKGSVFTHFPTLKSRTVSPEQSNKYSSILSNLCADFSLRFRDLEKIEKTLELVACPLACHYEEAPVELQLELIDLQCDPSLKEKCRSEKPAAFYASLSDTDFPKIREAAQKVLVLFGSTYLCEQTFSLLKCNRLCYRSWLSDRCLSSVLRISTTSLTPDFDAIIKRGNQLHHSR
ncbi:general transcription factor II-I repeat domain-containing protein 2-like [Rhinatrema bivittatum]|uniref:general transcription factor II-I repeat domain-containing protein 2-like n=1 Tax=Rhinatrema bivittatum TaxID=194408 RepID=UPI001125BCCB|nr:general transcription factor II-I repeat domain-containing protein 2-like [Rhinatrema bivittatum]